MQEEVLRGFFLPIIPRSDLIVKVVNLKEKIWYASCSTIKAPPQEIKDDNLSKIINCAMD